MRFILSFLILLLLHPARALNAASKPGNAAVNARDFSLKPSEFTRITGIRLTLKEKVALLIVQKKLKKQLGKKGKRARNGDPSKTAFIFGIIGLVLAFVPPLTVASVPLSILAIAIGNRQKKKDPTDRKARTAVTLGFITVGVILAVAVLVAYLLSNVQYF